MSVKKIVLAYSGGLDTSVAIHWLTQEYGCEVIAYIADVGQSEDLGAAQEKALAGGAKKVVVDDLRHTFVADYVFPALRAGAIYESEYLLGTSLARPCISKGMMRVVAEEGAQAISHGATGKGNDQVRFELAAYHFDPNIKVVAVWREWKFKSRSELIAYTRQHGIAVEATLKKPYSVDRNVFHTSYEGGVLEDPWREPDADMFQLTKDAACALDMPQSIEIEFRHGDPVAVDGKELSPLPLIEHLNKVAGAHGIGRVDIVENRFVGMKSRGVYETPGGTLLHQARRAVESLTLDREVTHLRDELVPRYARTVYNGFWFAPEREALQILFDDIQRAVNGTARLKLYRGAAVVTGRKSANSLYREDVATFEADSDYHQGDAAGFIRLNALRLRIRQQARKK